MTVDRGHDVANLRSGCGREVETLKPLLDSDRLNFGELVVYPPGQDVQGQIRPMCFYRGVCLPLERQFVLFVVGLQGRSGFPVKEPRS